MSSRLPARRTRLWQGGKPPPQSVVDPAYRGSISGGRYSIPPVEGTASAVQGPFESLLCNPVLLNMTENRFQFGWKRSWKGKVEV